jgi:hypothetical protein
MVEDELMTEKVMEMMNKLDNSIESDDNCDNFNKSTLATNEDEDDELLRNANFNELISK